MNKTFRTAMYALGLGSAAALGGAVSNTLLSGNSAFAHNAREVSEARASLAVAGDISTVFKTVDKAVEPSVVQIQTKAVVMQTGMSRNPFHGAARLGDDNGSAEIPNGNGGGNGGELVEQGTGSGVIMQVDGGNAYILTNNHVVDHAKSLLVTLNDGRQFDGAIARSLDSAPTWPS